MLRPRCVSDTLPVWRLRPEKLPTELSSEQFLPVGFQNTRRISLARQQTTGGGSCVNSERLADAVWCRRRCLAGTERRVAQRVGKHANPPCQRGSGVKCTAFSLFLFCVHIHEICVSVTDLQKPVVFLFFCFFEWKISRCFIRTGYQPFTGAIRGTAATHPLPSTDKIQITSLCVVIFFIKLWTFDLKKNVHRPENLLCLSSLWLADEKERERTRISGDDDTLQLYYPANLHSSHWRWTRWARAWGKRKKKKKRNRPPPPPPRCHLMDTDCRDQFTPGASISVDSWNSRQSEERESWGAGEKEWEIHIDCGDPSGVRSCVTRLCENICRVNCQRAGLEYISNNDWCIFTPHPPTPLLSPPTLFCFVHCSVLPSTSVSAWPPAGRPPNGSGSSDIYLVKCDCSAAAGCDAGCTSAHW